MSKHKKTPTIVPNTVEQQVKPTELQLTKLQVQRLTQEYQSLFQQALSYKESAYKNALAVNALIRTVTSKLLDLDLNNDDKLRDQINSIIKDINQLQKQPLTKEQDSDPV